MHPDFLQQELDRLEERIGKARKLRDEYEDLLDTSSDPRDRSRYERSIDQLQDSVDRYIREYTDLKTQLEAHAVSTQNLNEQLTRIEYDLRVLKGGQIAILGKLEQTRQTLINHYDATQRNLITKITEQLNQNQLKLVELLLDGLEDNQLSEAEMREILLLIEQRLPALPPEQSKVLEVLQDPELDTKHRLKVCLPLIPFILDYEGEIELGAGFNLKSLWGAVETRLRRK